MDADDSGPCPLQPISANAVSNQQQSHHEHSESISSLSSTGSMRRDSTGTTATTTSTHASNHKTSNSVGDKISQYNTLAMQTRHMERKATEAALKRAILGREEAENEMRRYRDEVLSLRKALEEGNERERRVGERLEAVMENHGRTKETHAHTQALWEKETRRSRKDAYKAQSATIKLQSELKASRDALRQSEEALEKEKERSHAREQEAFDARCEMVCAQEQLEQALARVRTAEQERDSFRTMAQTEMAARIAAEGRISQKEQTPEPASPFKALLDVRSSAAAESEIEELAMMVEWERRRADRALDMVEFLETECRMHVCSGSKATAAAAAASTTKTKPTKSPATTRRSVGPTRRRTSEINDSSDLGTIRETRKVSSNTPAGSPRQSSAPADPPTTTTSQDSDTLKVSRSKKPKLESDGKRSTIFCAREGIFRTVSQQEAAEIEARDRQAAEGRDLDLDVSPPSTITTTTTTAAAPPAVSHPPLNGPDTDTTPRSCTKSPSGDFAPQAMTAQEQQRMSLQSLLNAPLELGQSTTSMLSQIPTVPAATSSSSTRHARSTATSTTTTTTSTTTAATTSTTTTIPEESPQPPSPLKRGTYTRGKGTNGFGKRPRSANGDSHYDQENVGPGGIRPLSSAALYRVDTTSVPLRAESNDTAAPVSSSGGLLPRPPSAANIGLRVPSGSSAVSFDASDPAYCPTMTREEALAQIRERRGRARSAAMGNMTPRKKMLSGVGDANRNASAPAGRIGSAKRP